MTKKIPTTTKFDSEPTKLLHYWRYINETKMKEKNELPEWKSRVEEEEEQSKQYKQPPKVKVEDLNCVKLQKVRLLTVKIWKWKVGSCWTTKLNNSQLTVYFAFQFAPSLVCSELSPPFDQRQKQNNLLYTTSTNQDPDSGPTT